MYNRCKCSLILSAFILNILLALSFTDVKAQSTTIAEFSVDAGRSTYFNTPVSVSLEGISLQQHIGQLQLYEITGGGEVQVASQLEPGMNDRLFWILNGETEPGEVRSFELRLEARETAYYY